MFSNFKFEFFLTTSDGETTKIKVLDFKKLWHFVVDHFFIWNRSGPQTSNLHSVLYDTIRIKMAFRHMERCSGRGGCTRGRDHGFDSHRPQRHSHVKIIFFLYCFPIRFTYHKRFLYCFPIRFTYHKPVPKPFVMSPWNRLWLGVLV
jgi:hypothetical protein